MLTQLYSFIYSLFHSAPVRLAIVRRYADANGSYVGELYMEGTFAGVSSYRMIGASLDSMPLETPTISVDASHFALDTRNDFLAYMPPNTLRVGAIDPLDNDRVRKLISKLPRKRMSLIIQNGFIEHVLEPRKA